MPVKTRSQKQQQQQEQQYNSAFDDLHITTTAHGYNKGDRRVKIVTPSFVEASTRTYKVYSLMSKPPKSSTVASASSSRGLISSKKKRTLKFEDEASAAAALLALQDHHQENNHHDHIENDEGSQHDSDDVSSCSTASTVLHSHGVQYTCLNPMNPISKFIYRIGIYNIAQTIHYKTSYVLYDSTTRLYHVYTIISNQLPHQETHGGSAAHHEPRTEFTLPSASNTIQTKYKSYINDTVTNFIMTMVIPSNEHDYYIQDDVFGVVIQPNEFQKKAFNEESCFYDIEDMVYDVTSSETTNGFKAFMLIPSRNYWYSPVGAYYYTPTEANTVAYRDNKYTPQIVTSILSILSHS